MTESDENNKKLAQGQHLKVRMLHGLQPYEKVWRAMQEFTDHRDDQTEDELWVLQHEPVFTQGQAGKEEHILSPGDIPVVPVDRGGQVTYHGPGQLIVYVMFDIDRMGIGARELVARIEQSLVGMLALYGIDAAPKQDAPGVYVGDDKIASLGLRIRRGCSFHGLSLNVDMNLEPFGRINPCGYKDLKMIQLCDFRSDVAVERAAGCLVNELQKVFSFDDIVMEYADE